MLVSTTLTLITFAAALPWQEGMNIELGSGVELDSNSVATSDLLQPPTSVQQRQEESRSYSSLARDWRETAQQLNIDLAAEYRAVAASADLRSSWSRSISSTETSAAWTIGAVRTLTERAPNPRDSLSERGELLVAEIEAALSAGDEELARKLYARFTASCGDEYVDSITRAAREVVVFRSHFFSARQKEEALFAMQAKGSGVRANITLGQFAEELRSMFRTSSSIERNGRCADHRIASLLESSELEISRLMEKAEEFVEKVDMETAPVVSYTSRPWWKALGLSSLHEVRRPLDSRIKYLVRRLDRLDSYASTAISLLDSFTNHAELRGALDQYLFQLGDQENLLMQHVRSLLLDTTPPALPSSMPSPGELALGVLDLSEVAEVHGWRIMGSIGQQGPSLPMNWSWQLDSEILITMPSPLLIDRVEIHYDDRTVATEILRQCGSVVARPCHSAFHSHCPPGVYHTFATGLQKDARAVAIQKWIREPLTSMFGVTEATRCALHLHLIDGRRIVHPLDPLPRN